MSAKHSSSGELKLRRLLHHNMRLKDDLSRPHVRISEASASLIKYCKATKDHLVPSVWGTVSKVDDPFAPVKAKQGCACIVI